MKTAVLLVGQMRTWGICKHTFKWHVERQFSEPVDFFISTVKDDQVDSAYMTEETFPDSRIEIDVKEKQPELDEPLEKVRFEPYGRSVPVQAVLRQLWQLNEAWKFFQLHDEGQYDTIIRCRPDLYFHSFIKPKMDPKRYEAFTPWWGRFGGVNDRFALMGWDAARAYFTTYPKLANLMINGCPLHPESLVAASMWDIECEVRQDLKAEYSTLRLNGEMRSPEISPIDLAHAGLANLTQS